MASIVSERYALSLYEVAKVEGKVKEFFEEFQQVCSILEANPDFLKMLTTPSIAFADKQKTLKAVFDGRVHPYTLNFLMIITEKGRVGLIADMLDAYKGIYYLEEGITEVVAITAAPMADALIEQLKEKMSVVTGKKVVLKTQVDPSIIGGIVVKIDNKQIDTSVKTRLTEIARQLTQTIA